MFPFFLNSVLLRELYTLKCTHFKYKVWCILTSVCKHHYNEDRDIFHQPQKSLSSQWPLHAIGSKKPWASLLQAEVRTGFPGASCEWNRGVHSFLSLLSSLWCRNVFVLLLFQWESFWVTGPRLDAAHLFIHSPVHRARAASRCSS